MERPPTVPWSDLSPVAFIVAGIGFLFGAAVLVGWALTALGFFWGAVVAFVALVLVGMLIAFEVPRFWARLPR